MSVHEMAEITALKTSHSHNHGNSCDHYYHQIESDSMVKVITHNTVTFTLILYNFNCAYQIRTVNIHSDRCDQEQLERMLEMFGTAEYVTQNSRRRTSLSE
jgi:hypothetical protein